MKKLFLVESNQIFKLAFEKVFNSDEIYTLPSLEDLSFRAPDFGPDMLLLDATLIDVGPEEFWRGDLKACSEIPVVLVGFEKELERLKALGWDALEFKKPLDFDQIRPKIEELYTLI